MNSILPQILDNLDIRDEVFWEPLRLVRPGAWTGHLPTAFWLTKVVAPQTFVELGTHSGNSYSAFCQAISVLGLPTRAYAVDNWRGDDQAGYYDESVFQELLLFNQNHFSGFSKLLRATFEEARQHFPQGSIDLLHLDGLHTYDAVKHDFEYWRDALSPRAVVVMHDTNVRERDFGAWKLWHELREVYPSFEFYHSEGLGILGVGPSQPPALRHLFKLSDDSESSGMVRRLFAARGDTFIARSRILMVEDEYGLLMGKLQQESGRASGLEQQIASRDAALAERERDATSKSELIQRLQQEVSGFQQEVGKLQQQVGERDLIIRGQGEEIGRQAAALQQSEAAAASKDEQLKTLRGEMEALERSGESWREQLAAANQMLIAANQALNDERTAASAHISDLEQQLSGVQRDLGSIQASTSWKVASRVRAVFRPFPRLRQFLRRVARILWWTVTFQLFEKLRARRQLFELRDKIAASRWFDAEWYLSTYPDIAQAGIDPAMHYAIFGATDHRNPGPHFDADAYLRRNADVANAGLNPLVHYIDYGAAEGRTIDFFDGTPGDYQSWIERYDTLSEFDKADIRRHIEELANRPLISIVMPVYNTDPIFLRKALDSVRAQLYPHWELCIADDASTNPETLDLLAEYANKDSRIKVVFRPVNGHISAASNSALTLANGDFIALMDHDDVLTEHALYIVAAELNEHPNADIIYSDEDKIDTQGNRWGAYFKTDWNPELFYSQNMISHLGVYRASKVREIGGFRDGLEGSQDYDLALRVINRTTADKIRHIPFVLYSWRIGDGAQTFSTNNLPTAVTAARRALSDFFEDRGDKVQIVPSNLWDYNRVIRFLPDTPPMVSLIVPTRDRESLLRDCIQGLLYETSYPNLEIIVVDNGSNEIETLRYLEALRLEARVQVLCVPGPFNFSRLNNRAVEKVSGELIGFLNNDIKVIEPNWLAEMVGQAVQPGVGAVGAKLLYPNNTVQHGGVVLGIGGVAAHAQRLLPRDSAGYIGNLQLVRNVSCVTAACMLMPKKVFEEVGGFDEVNLSVAYNDVDLCLRIREAGYAIIWTPYAELYHLESVSRGSDSATESLFRIRQERAYMQRRWGATLQSDPFYSPNLTLEDDSYGLAFPPRVTRPW